MTKEKYNFYSLERTEELIYKNARQIANVFYFIIGFLTGILLVILFTTSVCTPSLK